jgi:hypothetical protein
MTQRPPSSEPASADTPPFDVGEAVDQLFQDIIAKADNPLLQTSITLLREETLAIRAYEAEMLTDREAEYKRMLDCWHRKDKRGLQRELAAYYERREGIAAQIANRMSPLN